MTINPLRAWSPIKCDPFRAPEFPQSTGELPEAPERHDLDTHLPGLDGLSGITPRRSVQLLGCPFGRAFGIGFGLDASDWINGQVWKQRWITRWKSLWITLGISLGTTSPPLTVVVEFCRIIPWRASRECNAELDRGGRVSRETLVTGVSSGKYARTRWRFAVG